jgi:hypothetical protein
MQVHVLEEQLLAVELDTMTVSTTCGWRSQLASSKW